MLTAALFAQAAAEGISVFSAGGDAGAAGCDTHGVAPPANPPNSIGINAYCGSSFVTCVGGTEFADTANPSIYWNATNGPGRSSAISYIPEGAWSDPINPNTSAVQVLAGGGGASMYFSKPAFQAGNGVPADGMRDTPDISFTASASHDGYIYCNQSFSPTSCTTNSLGNVVFNLNGGTSATAPTMAGIAALLDQKLGGPQGNLNPLIYRLANSSYSTIFHDATPASSGVPAANCVTTIANMCDNSVPGPSGLMGGQAGFLLTTGYDQATGWGSLDVANFVAAAATVVNAGLPTSSTLTGSSGTFTGPQSLTFNVAVAATGSSTSSPTGTVQFFVNGISTGMAIQVAAGQASYTVSSTTLSSVTTTTFGSFQVTAAYSGDTTFAASSSNVLALTLNPVGTTADSLSLTATPNPTDPTQPVTLTATFASTGSTNALANSITLYQIEGTSLSRLQSQPATNRQSTFTLNGVEAGTHTYVAVYPGDTTYAPATSPKLALVSNFLPTTTMLSGPAAAVPGSPITLTATVAGVYANYAPNSSTYMRFFDGGTLLGSKQPAFPASSSSSTTSGTATLSVALAAGSHSLTAVWPGDYYTTTSTSVPLTIASTAPGVSFSAALPVITVTAGSSGTDLLMVTSVGGYSGSANLSCAVTSNGTQAVTFAPTCSLSNSTLTLAAGQTANSTLSIMTTAPHAMLVVPAGRPRIPGSNHAGLVLCGLLALPAAFCVRRRQLLGPLLSLLLFAVATTLVFAASGCSSSGPSTLQPGTTAGSYTVTISGGAGTASSVLGTVGLTVQ